MPNRDAIARYGLTVRDVQDVVEAAVGGMPVSTAIAGRARFSINLRYAADRRSDPQALRRISSFRSVTGDISYFGGANVGGGTSTQTGGMVTSGGSATGGGMGAMGGRTSPTRMSSGGAMAAPQQVPPMGGLQGATDCSSSGASQVPPFHWRVGRRTRRHGPAHDQGRERRPGRLRVRGHRPDATRSRRRVDDAKALVAAQLRLSPGNGPQWTGQYEFLAQMEARLRYIIPLTLVLVVALLTCRCEGGRKHCSSSRACRLRSPAASGSWHLCCRHYNLSTAVWVGLIAVAASLQRPAS